MNRINFYDRMIKQLINETEPQINPEKRGGPP